MNGLRRGAVVFGRATCGFPPRRGTALSFCVASILAFAQLVRVEGAAFTPGNVVVLVPQGLSTATAATATSLVEYTPAGTVVQTIAIPGACTLNPAATSEGKLKLSFDGSRVSWGCFACAAGVANVAAVRPCVLRDRASS